MFVRKPQESRKKLPVRQIANKGDLLGESPVWCPKRQLLFWVDILGKKMHTLDPESMETTTVSTGRHMVGSFALIDKRESLAVACTQEGVGYLNVKSGVFSKVVDPESFKPSNRFNDGKADPGGRFVCGSMYGEKPKKFGAANLYTFEAPDKLVLREEVGDVTTSNGLGWSADGSLFYYIDSPSMTVRQYEYNVDTGAMSNGRDVVVIPKDLGGAPDGLAVDTDGNLWVALFRGGKVTKWDPTTSELLAVIDVPCQHVTSCCFGGKNLDKLFITTAKGSSAEEIHSNHNRSAGAVFMCTPGVTGVPQHEFTWKQTKSNL